MKTFRTSSDIYVAFCRCKRGHLHVLSLTNALATDVVLQGGLVGLSLFNFVLEWGTDKKKAAQIREAVESETGAKFFVDQQFKPGSLFFRRMAVNTEPYIPFSTTKVSQLRSEMRIISAMRHPSSSAITLTGNTKNVSAFVKCVSEVLERHGQPAPKDVSLNIPLSASEKEAGYCKIRLHFSGVSFIHKVRTPTMPILKALLKELS